MRPTIRWCCAALAAASLTAAEHHYRPTGYRLSFSSEGAPALRIRPGDTVITTSVDSEGGDETGAVVGPKYNALTGPFYIEGAERGDTLVIHLEKVRVAGKTGIASTRMSDMAITPREFVKGQPGSKGYRWKIDPAAGIATADISPSLAKLRIPLRPFPGCAGVAPANGESLSSLYAGAHGGNLDYNRIVEGTTLYFPVNVDGAYFFFGDGHAFQGDGELNGGAVEVPLHVTFRATVLPKKRIPSPRLEDEEFYTAIGVGNPLDTALQRAVANMVDWLTEGFGLERQAAHVLIGTSARLDIGSVVNERGNSVGCRIPKKLVREMRGE